MSREENWRKQGRKRSRVHTNSSSWETGLGKFYFLKLNVLLANTDTTLLHGICILTSRASENMRLHTRKGIIAMTSVVYRNAGVGPVMIANEAHQDF